MIVNPMKKPNRQCWISIKYLHVATLSAFYCILIDFQEQDVQNSHNDNKPVSVEQHVSNKPQENGNQQRSIDHHENDEHQGNTGQQDVNKKQEDGEHQQNDGQQHNDELQQNKDQQMSNVQQRNDEQQVSSYGSHLYTIAT